MSAFDTTDDEDSSNDDAPISIDQLDPVDDSLDLVESDLADFDFGGDSDLPFTDEEDTE